MIFRNSIYTPKELLSVMHAFFMGTKCLRAAGLSVGQDEKLVLVCEIPRFSGMGADMLVTGATKHEREEILEKICLEIASKDYGGLDVSLDVTTEKGMANYCENMLFAMPFAKPLVEGFAFEIKKIFQGTFNENILLGPIISSENTMNLLGAVTLRLSSNMKNGVAGSATYNYKTNKVVYSGFEITNMKPKEIVFETGFFGPQGFERIKHKAVSSQSGSGNSVFSKNSEDFAARNIIAEQQTVELSEYGFER